jgi:hypothetical protein
MNHTFQLKNRNLLSLPSGIYGLMSLATTNVNPNRTKSPKGLRTKASCQPSIDE